MQIKRIIGKYRGQNKGPLLVFIGGIHGNELSAIRALKEVFNLLEQYRPEISGCIIGLAGNVKAIELEKRYLDMDMNRVWLSEEIDEKVSEMREREELIKTISEIHDDEEEVYFFDLHSTSSSTTPFVIISDTLRNRELVKMVGVPVILGFLEQLHGMLIDVSSLSGIPTLLFQGGGEKDEETVNNHLGLIWKVLKLKCQLDSGAIPGVDNLIEKFNAFTIPNPDEAFSEISYMYKIPENAHFTMNSGYLNFQPIKKNEVLAVRDGKEVKAPKSGRIFTPLYQEHGKEGFFIIKHIAPVWIRFSRKLRQIRHHDKLHWLVGVKKVAKSPLTYRVDTQVTFLWAIDVFHLFGYIKIRSDGPFLFMSQREDEINPPSSDEALSYFTERRYLRNEIKEIESEWTIPFSGVKSITRN